jgi:hypothetical protein
MVDKQVTSGEALLPVNGLDLKEYLANLEKDLIKQALGDSDGVVARAASRLQLRRTTLVEKMRKYQLAKNFMGDEENVGEVQSDQHKDSSGTDTKSLKEKQNSPSGKVASG